MSDHDPGASLSPEVGEMATTRPETIAQTPPDRPPVPASAGRVPPTPMRYRPIHFHAKGGLGEVYVAEDLELRREVALKKINGSFAQDRDSRERFLFEAQVTGRLEHPGIVPVYGLVEDADGTPCYAMRYIQGETLRDAIRRYHAMPSGVEKRKELRNLLTRFVAVCNAVAYAHAQGVLHRDLKPSNILLDKYGETLVVDWGLAKALKPGEYSARANGAASTANGSTRIGKCIGTPGYMSPEQAAGHWDKVGPASDIFALGSTLVDILSLATENAQSQVAENETLDMSPGYAVPRFAGVPNALQAICRKAMAESPGDRYATALELAADVECWLAGEPVSACPEPLTARAHRWLSRHQGLVVAVCLAVFIMGLSLGAATVWLAAANKREAQEHANAEQNFQLAKQAVDQLYTEVSQNVLLNQPGMEDVRKRLLTSARDFYKKLVERHTADPAVKAGYGRAYWRLAFITNAIESKPKAIEDYQQAVAIFTELRQDYPEQPAYAHDLGKSLNNLGFAQSELNRLDEAAKTCGDALGIFEQLLERDPASTDYAKGAASALNNLALVYRSKKDEPKAEQMHERALAIRSRLAKDHPGNAEFDHDLAVTLNNLGVLYRATRRPDKAEQAYKDALAIRERLVAGEPGFNKYQHDLANSHNNLGLFYRGKDRRDEAREHLETAQAIWAKLVKEHPRVVEYQHGIATNSANLGGLYARAGQPELARKHFENAIGIWENLRRTHPGHAQFEIRLAASYGNMGTFLKENKNPQGALAWYQKAIDGLKAAADKLEADRYLRIAHWGRGEAYTLLKRHDDALADFDRCIELSSGAARDMMRLQRTGALARMGKYAQAIVEAEAVVVPKGEQKVPPGVLYNGACLYALACDAVRLDMMLPHEERERLGESYALRAIALLGQAKAAGFFAWTSNHGYLTEDPDLTSLRSRDDFKAFVAGIKK